LRKLGFGYRTLLQHFRKGLEALLSESNL